MELDYHEIGQNIRYYRQQKELSQQELAELIHVSDQHISHIENAHTKLSLSTLVAIANALCIDCNSLLGETQTGAREDILHRRLLDHLSHMDTRKLEFMIELCDVLNKYRLQ